MNKGFKPVKRFAENTKVTPEKSRAEAEGLLTKYGAKEVALMSSESAGKTAIVFIANSRRVKLEIVYPTYAEWKKHAEKVKIYQYQDRYTKVSTNWLRSELRRRWRVFVLRLKAKLEVCADDPAAFEREFLPDIMLPNGTTVGENIGPMLAEVYSGNRQLLTLPGLPSKD